MVTKKMATAKVLFGCFNTVFFLCGLAEVVCGFLLLCDSRRQLLSRLLVDPAAAPPQPPFYYLALAVLAGGLAVCAVAAMGCWAAYMPGYVILTIYFLSVLSLLLSACAGGALAALWPRCAGAGPAGAGLAGARAGAVHALQDHYAVEDFEQFTAAVDLAQTELQCCGVSDGGDYAASAWRSRRLGPRGLVVPPSCCVQRSPASYLSPQPVNLTRCQEQNPDPQFRYLQGCLDKLEDWYQEQYIVFLLALFVAALFKLGVLLSTVFSCIRLRRHRRDISSIILKSIDNKANENIYERKLGGKMREEPITAKYIQPDHFYSPRARNPRICYSYTKPHDAV